MMNPWKKWDILCLSQLSLEDSEDVYIFIFMVFYFPLIGICGVWNYWKLIEVRGAIGKLPTLSEGLIYALNSHTQAMNELAQSLERGPQMDLLRGVHCGAHLSSTWLQPMIRLLAPGDGLQGWPFSNTVCKMSGFVQGVSVSASVFTLVAIAIERFRCIVYPLQPKLTLLVAKVAIVSIWVLAVAIMCPAAVALTVEKVPFHYMVYNDDFNHTLPLYTCYENFANPQMRKVYTAVLFALIYLVPLTVITLMYVSIGVKLCSSAVAHREPQLAHATVQVGGRRHGQPVVSQKKIKVIKMLIVVALLFMLSWLPLWTLMMMADYSGLDRDQLDLMTSYIFPFAHWLAFSNSSVNPIVYGYYNKNFKRGFQAVCKTKPFCCITHLGSRMQMWGRRGRTANTPCQGTELRDGTNNHSNFVLGLRNRVHNDNKLSETPDENRSTRVGCVVVHKARSLSDQGLEMVAIHKKSSDGEASEKVSSLGVSVYQAWDN